jgi:hypothetical protein
MIFLLLLLLFWENGFHSFENRVEMGGQIQTTFPSFEAAFVYAWDQIRGGL